METYKTYLNQYLAGVAALDQGAGALESGLQVMNEKKRGICRQEQPC